MISPWIPLAIGAVCLLIMSIFIANTWYRFPVAPKTPSVAIVVCARDEEDNLMDCLMSLASQDYPDDKLRLILVDHLSQDNTGNIMERFASDMPFETQVIHITEPDPNFKGKVQALVEGLDQLHDEEYVLLTDADCVVPELWVRTLLARFTENVIAVGGIPSIDSESSEESNWLTRLQDIDFRYYYGYAFGLTSFSARLTANKEKNGFKTNWRLIRPAIVSGNNLAFKASLYKECGGFRKIGSSLIEDVDLLLSMINISGGHLAITVSPDARVQTAPQPTLRKLWQQRRRWATSINSFHFFNYFLFLIIFVTRVMLPAMIFIQPWGALGGLLIYSLATAAMVLRVSSLLNRRVHFSDLIMLELFQIFLHSFTVLAVLVRWPVIWKGVNYRKVKA